MTWSGFGIIFLAINQVYSSCLQAVDERYVSIRNLTIAVIVKFFIEIVFMPSKLINVYSLAIANTACYILVMVLNFMEMRQHFKMKINYEFWAKLIFANCVMVFSMILFLAISKTMANTILSIIVAVVVYFGCLFITNILSRRDRALFKYKV